MNFNEIKIKKSILWLLLCFFCGLDAVAQGDFEYLHAPIGNSPEAVEVVPETISEEIKSLDIQELRLENEALPDSLNNENEEQQEPLTDASLKEIKKKNESEKADLPTLLRNLRQVEKETVLFYVFVVLLLVYAVLRLRFGVFLLKIIRSFFNPAVCRIVFNELSYRDNTAISLLILNIALTFGLVLFHLANHFLGFNTNVWELLPLVIGGFCLLLLLRHSLLSFLSWVFPLNETVNFYQFTIFVINSVASLFFLPLLLLSSFSANPKNIVIFSTLFLAFWFIFGVYRLFRGAQSAQVLIIKHPIYFFLYLCTLEIAPIALCYGFFTNIS